ncbi:hypothetical protein GCM10023091_33860 [Ravibacter arvi]|uniref:Heparinase n=1 Tax=Ravibacter arvi TaxID=2051041 RepID=A0ABP8M416_9BACT
MKPTFLLFLCALSFVLRAQHSPTFDNGVVRFGPVALNEAEKNVLLDGLDALNDRYDPAAKMLTRKLNGYNYHTDAESGVFHEVRASFNYAVRLLDLGDERLRQRAFDIIEATIALQDTNSTSRYAGVWPYYSEEPLSTKKSPVDFNWADFNAVSLLDVYMGHYGKLPDGLKRKIINALVLAGKSVQKRNVQPGYTNIAIMGTYVTFMVSHLFDLKEMQQYSRERLKKFYDYTLERGFTEYNSPTYTIVSLDELDRMKRHIADAGAKPMIDSLYSLAWEVIAQHFHMPSGQWAGPHSRSYSTVTSSSIYGILKQASGGKIDFPGATARADVKIRHKIPDHLLSYFLAPDYPRTQQDEFAVDPPKVTGTTFLTDRYAFSSANRSSLWNQRRPLLVYWGKPSRPNYIQLRFLHDGYDFCSASFYSSQKENRLLGGISFLTNGGDKHINIDRLQDGRFSAGDLRMRFEFAHAGQLQDLHLPRKSNAPFRFETEGLPLQIQLFESHFDDLKGYWEKGTDGQVAWLDYVIYSGDPRAFDLSSMQRAVLGFSFSIPEGDEHSHEKPVSSFRGDQLEATWKDLRLEIPAKPGPQPKNL